MICYSVAKAIVCRHLRTVPDYCLNLLDRLGNENDLLLGRNCDGSTHTSTEKKLVRQLKCKSTPLDGVADPRHDDPDPAPY